MKGKEKCRILKEIRQKIADENGIEYTTSECKHEGDCLGTCPKCESEVRFLERELTKKRSLGKRIAVAGIAASLVVSGVSCAKEEKKPTLTDNTQYVENKSDTEIENEMIDGLLPAPETEEELIGEIEAPTEAENEELMGEPEALPEDEVAEIMGEVPAYFFPETPEEYNDYSAEFISASMEGMNIDDVKAAWGTEDMNQISGDRGIIAYFTEARDIIIQYNVETNLVINAAVIENDE